MTLKTLNKKAQLQITENVVIIIIIIFIFIIGIVFYNNVKKITYVETVNEYSDLDLVKASQKITNLPELSCSFNEQVEVGCVDELKLEAVIALDLLNTSYSYYYSIFGKSKVIINTTFPEQGKGFVIYDSKLSGDYNQIPLVIPIKVYNPINMTTNLGYVQILKYTEVFN